MMFLRMTGMAALLLATPGPALAQVDCASAREDYGQAIDQIETRLRPYVKCINESGGANDCMLEFKQLERAQKKFDEAILAIRLQCRPDRDPRGGPS